MDPHLVRLLEGDVRNQIALVEEPIPAPHRTRLVNKLLSGKVHPATLDKRVLDQIAKPAFLTACGRGHIYIARSIADAAGFSREEIAEGSALAIELALCSTPINIQLAVAAWKGLGYPPLDHPRMRDAIRKGLLFAFMQRDFKIIFTILFELNYHGKINVENDEHATRDQVINVITEVFSADKHHPHNFLEILGRFDEKLLQDSRVIKAGKRYLHRLFEQGFLRVAVWVIRILDLQHRSCDDPEILEIAQEAVLKGLRNGDDFGITELAEWSSGFDRQRKSKDPEIEAAARQGFVHLLENEHGREAEEFHLRNNINDSVFMKARGIFGYHMDRHAYDAVRGLCNGEITEELRQIGVKNTGDAGVLELTRRLRQIRHQLIFDNLEDKTLLDLPIIRRILMNLLDPRRRCESRELGEILDAYFAGEIVPADRTPQHEPSPVVGIARAKAREGRIVPFQFMAGRDLFTLCSGEIMRTCFKAPFMRRAMQKNANLDSVAMVAYPGHEVYERIGGASFLVRTMSKQGEPLLLIRGLNLQENFTNLLDIEAFFDTFVDYVRGIADREGRKLAIVIDEDNGRAATNRKPIFEFLKGLESELTPVKLARSDEDKSLGDYSIQDKCYFL